MIKKFLLAAAVILPFLASAQTLKIGMVDTNAIIAAMPETTAAQTTLQDIQKKYEADYNKLGDEMKRLYDEVTSMKEDELPAIRDRKTRELQDQQQKIQLFEQQISQDLQKKQEELFTPILSKVRSAVESVGRENSFSLIQDYNTQLTLYIADPVVDITPLVKAKLGLK
ncbi:MAG: OmpH family outer membrane protein [Muribaculum sp.]|nr:OmpH family outer membrane protein [Muribaculum sp.]